MIFLTNKPLSTFKNVHCRVSGFTFKELNELELPSQVVVDVTRDYSTRALEQIIHKYNCRYIESPVELNHGNVIYIVQDAMQNIVKIEAL